MARQWASAVVALVIGSLGCSSESTALPPSSTPLCGAPCEQFATFDKPIEALAFDDARVVALVEKDEEFQEIVAVSATGDTEKTLATHHLGYEGQGQSDPHALAVQGGVVLFLTDVDLEKVTIGGGGATVVTKGSPAMSVVADATAVVFSAYERLLILPLGGTGAKLDLPEHTIFPCAVGMDADNVYWHELSVFGSATPLHASPRDGGPSRLVLSTGVMIGFARDGGDAYIAEGGFHKNRFDGKIVKVPLADGPPEVLLAIDNLPAVEESVSGLALDKSFVYFPLGNRVVALPKAGGELQTFADVAVGYVAASATHVYFVPRADPTVLLRQPKLAP